MLLQDVKAFPLGLFYHSPGSSGIPPEEASWRSHHLLSTGRSTESSKPPRWEWKSSLYLGKKIAPQQMMVHCLIRVVKIFVAMCAHGIGAVWMDFVGKWSWIQMLSIPETRASNAIRWICGMPSAKTQNTKVQSHTSHSRSSNFNILAIWIRKKHIFEKTCWMINDYCHHPKDNCCIPDLPSSKREKVGSKSFGHVVVAPPKRQPSIFLTQVFPALRRLLDTVYQAADLMIWSLINRIRFQKTIEIV